MNKYGIGDREIKVKGKSVSNGEWVYGGILRDTTDRVFIVPIFDSEFQPIEEIIVHVHTMSVGQHTGLKDKNRKEIYEGDIVKCLQFDKIKIKGIIIYSTENNRYEVLTDKIESFSTMAQCSCYEIIGNIFETPELLDKTFNKP